MTMETLIVHADSEEKPKALKAVLKALKIDFEKSTYNPEMIAKVKGGEKDLQQNKGVKISLDDIWK